MKLDVKRYDEDLNVERKVCFIIKIFSIVKEIKYNKI